MSNDTFTLVKWIQRSAWTSRFEKTRREVGDTNIVTKQTANNLQRVGLVKIIGPADDVIPKVMEADCEGGDYDGADSSNDTLSPFEG